MLFTDLINLPVYTKSGQRIGRVRDLQLDESGRAVQQYVVHTGNLLPQFLGKDLLVHYSQVIEITAERMIVADTMDPALKKTSGRRQSISPSPASLMQSTERE